MKLRELEQILEDVDDFTDPKIIYEQYKTRPHLAACLLHSASHQFEDIEDKIVVDLGCGTGCLSIGAVVLEWLLVVDDTVFRVGPCLHACFFSYSCFSSSISSPLLGCLLLLKGKEARDGWTNERPSTPKHPRPLSSSFFLGLACA